MPDVYLTQEVAYMIQRAARHTPTLEVGGLLRAEVQNGDGGAIILVTDMVIPPQTVGAAHQDIEGEQFTAAWTDTKVPYRGLWHSHCNMAVTPSAVDTDQLEELSLNEGLDWMIGLVVNVRGEMHCWIVINNPIQVTAKLDVGVLPVQAPELDSAVDEMMKGVKKEPSYAYGKWPSGSYRIVEEDDDAKAATAAYLNMQGVDEELVDIAAFERAGREEANGKCTATAITSTGGQVGCGLVKGHQQKTHAAVDGRLPVYFEDSGKPTRWCSAKREGVVCALPLGHKTAMHIGESSRGVLVEWSTKRGGR